MQKLACSTPPRVPHIASGGICPRCGGSVYRVQRRSFDHLINVFMPVYRYHCASLGCDWEGNLRVPPDPTQK